MLVLRQADGFDAAAHGHLHAVVDDLARGDGDGHQARGAHAVHAHAGGGHGQAGRGHREATDVVTLRALLGGGPDDHVLDRLRLDAGPRHRLAHRVTGKHRRLGVVEGAAEGLADRGAGNGDDDGFTHGSILGIRLGSSG